MPRREWRVRIQDMLDAIANIRRFIAPLGEAGFVRNDVVFSAVASQRIWQSIHEQIFPVEDALRAILDAEP